MKTCIFCQHLMVDLGIQEFATLVREEFIIEMTYICCNEYLHRYELLHSYTNLSSLPPTSSSSSNARNHSNSIGWWYELRHPNSPNQPAASWSTCRRRCQRPLGSWNRFPRDRCIPSGVRMPTGTPSANTSTA